MTHKKYIQSTTGNQSDKVHFSREGRKILHVYHLERRIKIVKLKCRQGHFGQNKKVYIKKILKTLFAEVRSLYSCLEKK